MQSSLWKIVGLLAVLAAGTGGIYFAKKELDAKRNLTSVGDFKEQGEGDPATDGADGLGEEADEIESPKGSRTALTKTARRDDIENDVTDDTELTDEELENASAFKRKSETTSKTLAAVTNPVKKEANAKTFGDTQDLLIGQDEPAEENQSDPATTNDSTEDDAGDLVLDIRDGPVSPRSKTAGKLEEIPFADEEDTGAGDEVTPAASKNKSGKIVNALNEQAGLPDQEDEPTAQEGTRGSPPVRNRDAKTEEIGSDNGLTLEIDPESDTGADEPAEIAVGGDRTRQQPNTLMKSMEDSAKELSNETEEAELGEGPLITEQEPLTEKTTPAAKKEKPVPSNQIRDRGQPTPIPARNHVNSAGKSTGSSGSRVQTAVAPDEPEEELIEDTLEIEKATPPPAKNPPAKSRTLELVEGTSSARSRTGGSGTSRTPNVLDSATTRTQRSEENAMDLNGISTIDRQVDSGPARPELRVFKEAPTSATLGKAMVYRIVVRNVGESPARNVHVEDPIPAGARLEGTKPQAEITRDNKVLHWKFDSLGAGEERVIKVKITPTQRGQIGSIATVNFEAEVAAQTTINAPELSLNMDAAPEVAVGETVELKFVVKNNGAGEAVDVMLRNQLPPELTHPEGDDLDYSIGNLAGGESSEITLRVTASQAGTAVANAQLSSVAGTTEPVTTEVNVLPHRVSVQRTGPKRRLVGLMADYANVVENHTRNVLRNVVVREEIPEGFTFDEASDNGRYDANNRVVEWTIVELPPRGKQMLRVKLMPELPGTHTSLVSLIDAAGNRANLTGETIVEGLASLVLDVRRDGRPVAIGDSVTFRLVFRNKGTASATNVRSAIILPKQVTLLNAEGLPYKQGKNRDGKDGQQIVFDAVETLEPDQEIALDLLLRAEQVTGKNGTRIRVQWSSDELQEPLDEDEGLVIYDPKE